MEDKSNVSVKNSLVDFQLKKLDEMTNEEKQQYEEDKE